jgi:hypothetical protein
MESAITLTISRRKSAIYARDKMVRFCTLVDWEEIDDLMFNLIVL